MNALGASGEEVATGAAVGLRTAQNRPKIGDFGQHGRSVDSTVEAVEPAAGLATGGGYFSMNFEMSLPKKIL
ncbi:MAG TPA: hypothetical protein VE990_12075 [Acidimicrobiales bacterium]|nr:hypothetical protein [Acidimicrobiales bacterium]